MPGLAYIKEVRGRLHSSSHARSSMCQALGRHCHHAPAGGTPSTQGAPGAPVPCSDAYLVSAATRAMTAAVASQCPPSSAQRPRHVESRQHRSGHFCTLLAAYADDVCDWAMGPCDK